MYYKVCGLYDKMYEYINRVTVIGFRSSKYDLLVVRSKLFPKLGLHIKGVSRDNRRSQYVIKRGQSYPCVSNSQYKFLDITEYVGPISYAQFLKSMKVKEGRKLFFPYEEAAKTFSDLETIGLPPIESLMWYSNIKQKSILDDGVDSIGDNYNMMCDIWEGKHMTCLMDLLIEYNNSDVGPFVSALESFQVIFWKHHINVFTSNAISASGLSRQLLFATAERQNIPLTLFDSASSDLYYSFKKQCYGGASIIFHRHHKVGSSYVRGNKSKPCQSLMCVDGVGLYLSCISARIPVGFPIRRDASKGFKPEVRDRSLCSIHWMDWLNKLKNKHILHRYNTGKKPC